MYFVLLTWQPSETSQPSAPKQHPTSKLATECAGLSTAVRVPFLRATMEAKIFSCYLHNLVVRLFNKWSTRN